MEALKNWKKEFWKLEHFSREHPEIEINEDIISIDEGIRSDFYSMFNTTRIELFREKCSSWLDSAEYLSAKYAQLEAEIMKMLRLEAIMLPTELRRSLSSPLQQGARSLFEPLFEVLKGNLDLEEFEAAAFGSMKDELWSLYRRGYVRWVILALIKKLKAEKIYAVPIPQPSSKEIIKHSSSSREIIPYPEETNQLWFEIGRRDILLVPDFIIQSAYLNKYVAIRTSIGKAIWEAVYHSEDREWIPIADIVENYEIVELKPEVLIYVGDKLEDLALVADCHYFCRPDLILDFMADNDMEIEDYNNIERVKAYHMALKPTRGTYIISDRVIPKELSSGLREDIQFMNLGFDDSKLIPVLEIMSK